MGLAVWLAGCAGQPHTKISFSRPRRRESGRCFHNAGILVEAVMSSAGSLDQAGLSAYDCFKPKGRYNLKISFILRS